MDDQIRMGGFRILPPGVKNLLIVNTLLFFATLVFQSTGLCDLDKWLGLHYFSASHFYPWQFVTYMFMHANFEHLFFNMFALWMFGSAVENHWGTKRFLVYYFITGIGAALCHYLVIFFQLHPMVALFNQFLDNPSLETYRYLVENNKAVEFDSMLRNNLLVLQQSPQSLPELVNVTYNALDNYLNSINIVGASGAVYGCSPTPTSISISCCPSKPSGSWFSMAASSWCRAFSAPPTAWHTSPISAVCFSACCSSFCGAVPNDSIRTPITTTSTTTTVARVSSAG